jgi:hypothetical protein
MFFFMKNVVENLVTEVNSRINSLFALMHSDKLKDSCRESQVILLGIVL